MAAIDCSAIQLESILYLLINTMGMILEKKNYNVKCLFVMSFLFYTYLICDLCYHFILTISTKLNLNILTIDIKKKD